VVPGLGSIASHSFSSAELIVRFGPTRSPFVATPEFGGYDAGRTAYPHCGAIYELFPL
jgi:hypothetical protein